MTTQRPTDEGKRKRKGANVVVWVLMGLVIVGVSGFGVTNFGGGVTSIGSVGGREISTNEYARALQQETAALSAQVGQSIPFSQAQAFGLDARVRQQLVVKTALDAEAERLGLSVGDARVAQELTAMDAFKGPAGQFDRETYRFALERSNLSEPEFETGLRDDLARTILQGAVVGGFVAPSALTGTLYAYVAERRGLTLLRLTERDLPAPPPNPTEAELQAHYDANIAEFTKAEAKRITYAALLPEALAETMLVDEAELRKIYDERIAEYVQPERRLVERLVFPDEAAAGAAKARLDAGETFETMVAERGLTLDDIDLGDRSKDELGAAGDAVFGLSEPGIVGPFTSDLGPALYRMNAILSAQEVTFEEARVDLRVEAQQEAARRAIADRVDEIDDQLAGGATLEELAQGAGMTLGTLDFNTDSDDLMAQYPAFRTVAAVIEEGDFPEVVTLDDGGLVAMRLENIVAATPIPFAEALSAVTESWRAAALAKALSARATEIKTAVEGGAPLSSFGILSVSPEVSRDSVIDGAPEGFMTSVFKMAEGELQVVEGAGFTGLVHLDSIRAASDEGDDAAALKGAIAAQGEQALAQDAFALVSGAIAADAGLTLNESAINAVHAQFP